MTAVGEARGHGPQEEKEPDALTRAGSPAVEPTVAVPHRPEESQS